MLIEENWLSLLFFSVLLEFILARFVFFFFESSVPMQLILQNGVSLKYFESPRHHSSLSNFFCLSIRIGKMMV